MLRTIMLVALFFAATGSLADDTTSVCQQFDNKEECQAYVDGQCAWDHGTQLCQPSLQVDHRHGCRFKGYYECLDSRHCYWEHGRCHRYH